MTRTMVVLALSVLLAFGDAGPARSGGGGISGFSTEVTQLLNHAELVSQLQTQIAQLNDMIQQALRLPKEIWNDVNGQVMQLRSIIDSGCRIAYTLENLDEVFKQQFSGFEDAFQISLGGMGFEGTMQDYTQRWSEENLETIKTVLKGIGKSAEDFQTEADTLRELQSMSQSAEGRLQAIQAANQIATFEAQQLMKLREVAYAQIQIVANQLAREEDEKAKKAATFREHIKVCPNPIDDGKGY